MNPGELEHEAPLPDLGDRVMLLNMPDDPDPIPPGEAGTVDWIGDENVVPRQVGVKWDSGRSLILLLGVDLFEITTAKPKPSSLSNAQLRRVEGRS